MKSKYESVEITNIDWNEILKLDTKNLSNKSKIFKTVLNITVVFTVSISKLRPLKINSL